MDYPTPIVSVAWLHDHLENKQIQVVDCRFALMDPSLGIRQYQSEHIPGAIHLDLNRNLSSPVQTHGGRHPLPNIDQLAKTLGQSGIKSQSTFVVAYDDSRFAFAARLWWLLRYMGHEQVAILDGGLMAWKNAGYRLTQEIPECQAVAFDSCVQSNWVVNINYVKQHKDLPGTVLVDSRQGDRYRGEREPIDPVAGHIPGAVNLFWQEATTNDGHIKSVEQQQARWHTLDPSPTRLITQAGEIIIYCGSGVTACVNLLSLEQAGIQGGKLYPGSWSDWCSYL